MKIKSFSLAFLTAMIWAASSSRSYAAHQLRIVATIPELVDITQRVGADLVKVDGLARGTEDIHQVVMKPSYVTKLNIGSSIFFV